MGDRTRLFPVATTLLPPAAVTGAENRKCPDVEASQNDMCVIVDGLAFLVGVGTPEQPAPIAADGVVSVTRVAEAPLLLLASDNGLTAVGVDGVQWVVPRLVVDDLRVLRTSTEAIVCSGNVGDRMATITLTPQSGAVWGSDYR